MPKSILFLVECEHKINRTLFINWRTPNVCIFEILSSWRSVVIAFISILCLSSLFHAGGQAIFE